MSSGRIQSTEGFVDLQVNGFAGCDYNSPEASFDQIGASIGAQAATGVTRLLPTVITGPAGQMVAALGNLWAAKQSLPNGAAIAGFHVEGPHISAEDGPRGAHPRQFVRAPNLDEYRRWQEAAGGTVRLVTLAPEWPGATKYIESLAADGVVVSIGHTSANRDQIADAVRAGATLSTHLGNGAHRMMARHPNYIWDQLAEDRLSASFIVDGHHLPAAFLKTAVRAKGVERSILVTDAVMPAGCEPGRYRIGVVAVVLHPGNRVTLAGDDRLAGSALRMDRAVERVMREAGVSLPHALAMANTNPARLIGIAPAGRVEYRYEEETGAFEVMRTEVN